MSRIGKWRSWIAGLPPERAGTAEKCMLHALVQYADLNDGSCYPGVTTLARDTSMSARTAGRVLKRLESNGLIHAEWSRGGKTHRFWLPLNTETGSGFEGAEPRKQDGVQQEANPENGAPQPRSAFGLTPNQLRRNKGSNKDLNKGSTPRGKLAGIEQNAGTVHLLHADGGQL